MTVKTMRERLPIRCTAAAIALLAGAGAAADSGPLSREGRRARDIYQELIEIDTVTATGDTARAAAAMAARLRAAGFPPSDVHVFTPAPRKGNLVARLRGTGRRRPLLLVAHLDVVEARPEDWSTDPFKLVEKDGYFYARGSWDDKLMAAAFVSNLIRYREAGYRPERDIIVVLETDEEVLDEHRVGMQWLLEHHRDLVDAELALNEGGSVGTRNGRPLVHALQTAEKVPVNFVLEVKSKGGHSAVPARDNAIYRLAHDLERLSGFQFPVELNDTTRAWFQAMASHEAPEVGADMRSAASSNPEPSALERLSAHPAYNAQLRTTCVPTLLEGGHAANALPQTARATVNCRVLPGASLDRVRETLAQVIADDGITITRVWSGVESPPSQPDAALLRAASQLTSEFWPGTPVIPTMSPGASDGSFLRNAGILTYGHSGVVYDMDDMRAHGKDERVSVKAFHDANEYLYRLVELLAGGAGG